jgi:hypothetical protein
MSDHFGKIILHRLSDPRIGDRAMLDQLAVLIPVIVYPVQVSHIFVELVIAQLEIDILQNEQTGGHADRQADNIDERKYFILSDISPGGG